MTKVLIVNNEKNRNNLGFAPRIQKALARESEVKFEILHYTELSKEKIKAINPDMIYLTGRLTYAGDLMIEDYTAELELIRETDIPILGICLGHQLISIAHGANLGRMVEVPKGEADIREEGFVDIRICRQDYLFNGIHEPFSAYEYHLEEVKEVPAGFELLASSDICKVQTIKHKEKLIYGMQFHPEGYNQDHPTGEIILQNFFSQVRRQVVHTISPYVENVEAQTL